MPVPPTGRIAEAITECRRPCLSYVRSGLIGGTKPSYPTASTRLLASTGSPAEPI